MNILVTGAAGFIGYHLAHRLLKDGHSVIGLDNVNDYYDVNLKRDRLRRLETFPAFELLELDLQDTSKMRGAFEDHTFDAVVHLAAQAGVRHSLTHPHSYVESNLTGFVNILEGCRHHRIGHLVFASSSSVYGANVVMPLSTHQNVDHPLSLYAATKKANELMAHTYAHLFGVPCTGLRFFTVYGPWGRPDMALFLFTRAILAGEPIRVFNHGKMKRDFTYIDDIIESVVRMIPSPPSPNPEWDRETPDPATSYAPYRVYNIGNNRPVELMEYIGAIEKCLGKEAEKEFLPLQPGDVPATCADVRDLERDFGFRPNTTIQEGISRFIEWYRQYYSV